MKKHTVLKLTFAGLISINSVMPAFSQTTEKQKTSSAHERYIANADQTRNDQIADPTAENQSNLSITLKGNISDIIFSNEPVQLALGKSPGSVSASGFSNNAYTVPVTGLYVIEGAFTISPGTFFDQHSGVIGIHLKNTGNDRELVSNFVSGLYGPILGETWAGTSISLTGKAIIRLNAGTTIAAFGNTYGAGSTTQMQVQFLSFQRIQ
ncbi:hypothetical protein [Pedobacter sp. SYP-B3415]|uniref:hypothetical protein n=1 Tax=Pedobacter sp. SYP-B3415 TaxID=2496641 RepID=UPI00101BEB3E|nr:hypothetical protein [Pedobacter sp. SYP-B3415]